MQVSTVDPLDKETFKVYHDPMDGVTNCFLLHPTIFIERVLS